MGEQRIVSTFVTPDMAIEALAANTNNRKVMPRRVALLVAEIESSRWEGSGAIRGPEDARGKPVFKGVILVRPVRAVPGRFRQGKTTQGFLATRV